MKKERRLKLQMNKVSVSKLNNTIGGGSDIIPSVNFPCVITTEPKSIPGDDCRTGNTLSNQSVGACLASTDRC